MVHLFNPKTVDKLSTPVKDVFILRVSFFSLNYIDSGEYYCSAWTSHPDHKTTRFADLFVFYPGKYI